MCDAGYHQQDQGRSASAYWGMRAMDGSGSLAMDFQVFLGVGSLEVNETIQPFHPRLMNFWAYAYIIYWVTNHF